MQIRTEHKNEKILYPLAKAWVRFIVRCLDSIIVIGIMIGLFFLIKEYASFSFGIEFLLIVILGFLVSFIYFVVVSFFTKGYTLFRWIFRIKLIELIHSKKYFWHLIVHDMLIWMHFGILTLIYAIITACQPVDQQRDFFDALINTRQDSMANTVAIIFKILYSASALTSLIFMIYSFINSGKRSIPDLMSWTAMINLNKPTPQNKNVNVNASGWTPDKALHLPGSIEISEEDN